jgi:hypothetical protein
VQKISQSVLRAPLPATIRCFAIHVRTSHPHNAPVKPFASRARNHHPPSDLRQSGVVVFVQVRTRMGLLSPLLLPSCCRCASEPRGDSFFLLCEKSVRRDPFETSKPPPSAPRWPTKEPVRHLPTASLHTQPHSLPLELIVWSINSTVSIPRDREQHAVPIATTMPHLTTRCPPFLAVGTQTHAGIGDRCWDYYLLPI